MVVSLSALLQAITLQRVDCGLVEIYAPGGVRFPGGRHAQFHLVLDGAVVLGAAGWTEPLRIAAGEFVFLPKGRPHEVWDAAGSTATDVPYFQDLYTSPGSFLDSPPVIRVGTGRKTPVRIISGIFPLDHLRGNPLVAGLPPLIHLKEVNFGAATPTMPPTEEIALDTACTGPGATEFMRRLVEVLLLQAIRKNAGKTMLLARMDPRAIETARMLSAMRLVAAKPEAKWSVSSIARQIGMSRSAFAASFSTRIGKAPMRYVTEVRMDRAAELLRFGNMSIVEVAHAVGFDSEAYFSRIFKKHFNTSPRGYRGDGDAAGGLADFSPGPWDPFLQ